MSAFVQVADVAKDMRRGYLASLPEPQEWFLEELVRAGEVWAAPGLGYAVFHGDTLVEFHVVERANAAAHLDGLRQVRPFAKALGKSFDHVLMDAARALRWAAVETGYLFRKRRRVAVEAMDGFRLAQAEAGNLPDVWATGRDFYDSADEVAQIHRSGGLWVAFHHSDVVGSGVVIPLDGTGAVADIGMVTRPDQRKKGIASLVISTLADHLERAGVRPICGCAERNIGSKAALENAGFVTEHRLVQISVPG